MNKRSAIRLIAAFLLLMGQWIAVVHAAKHDTTSELKAACEICSVAHVGAGTPALIFVPTEHVAPQDPPLAFPAKSPAAQIYPRPFGTGPPAILT